MGRVLRAIVVCLLLVGVVAGGEKAGKKQERSESFDIKPSGQVTHQTVQLVSTTHSYSHFITYIYSVHVLYALY